jgi:putative ABC transport system substrate-binding protein
MPVIGFPDSGSAAAFAARVAAFRRGLGETAYVEGQNVAIEYRWADARYDRYRHWPMIWFAAEWP